MPGTLIEVRRQLTAAQEIAIIETVHAALVQAFRIPPDDKTLRLIVHEPHRFMCPPETKQPELVTLVTIDAFPGRSLDAKRSLYKAIVAGLERLGIPRSHVTIVLREIPTENWGIRGGQAACDADLGYKVEV